MKNIIKWFVLLLHKDMQTFEMDGNTSKSVYRQIRRQIGKDSKK